MKNIKMHIAGKLFQLKLRLIIQLVFLMQSPMSLCRSDSAKYP